MTMSINSYLFEIFSMRTRIMQLRVVLNAYNFKTPSKDRQTSSTIAKASLSHQVPARDIPPPSPPSPAFKNEHKMRKSQLQFTKWLKHTNNSSTNLHRLHYPLLHTHLQNNLQHHRPLSPLQKQKQKKKTNYTKQL